MIFGVTKMSSSTFSSVCLRLRNSAPTTGSSPKKGTRWYSSLRVRS